MAIPRRRQISLIDTKYYHCISRCVRRAFLCGRDAFSGRSYEHRRQWIEDKLCLLVEVFCIDICAYAVMSNHLHVVLHVDYEKAQQLDDKAVLRRWHLLFKGTLLTQKYIAGEMLSESEQLTLEQTVEIYRKRLFNISWFMRALNEDIARRANKEDDCSGRFWEERFKSQALLDEAALAACMAYVDLNPVRAKEAKTPEDSEYTSIKKRVESAKKGKQPKSLLPFVGNRKNAASQGLPFDFKSYVELVENTGLSIRSGEKGLIDVSKPILDRLNISPENWIELTTQFTRVFHGAVGRKKVLHRYCKHLNIKRRVNLSQCLRLLA